MSFTCAICSLEIQTGEPMLSNDKMELAHQSCVDRRVDMDPPSAIQLRPPALPQLPPGTVVLSTKVSGPGFGNPTAAIGKPSDAVKRCPRCDSPLGPVLRGSYAHYPDSRFCESCVRFIEEPRQPSPPPCDTSSMLPVMKPAFTLTSNTIEIAPARKNGKHVSPKQKKKGRSRR